MTSIEDLRKKYGDAPTPLKGFKFEAEGYTFTPYLVRVSRSTGTRKAQVALRGGNTVEIDINVPEESELRNNRAYFVVHQDKPLLLIYESDQHLSDHLECKKGYISEQDRIIREHVKGKKDEATRLQRVQKKHDDLEKKLEEAERKFNLGFLTDVNYNKLQEYATDVSKWRGKLRRREAGPAKPDVSFLVPIRLHAPMKISFPDAFVSVADSLHADFVKRLGVVPTLPQTITVLGVLKSEVMLRK